MISLKQHTTLLYCLGGNFSSGSMPPSSCSCQREREGFKNRRVSVPAAFVLFHFGHQLPLFPLFTVATPSNRVTKQNRHAGGDRIEVCILHPIQMCCYLSPMYLHDCLEAGLLLMHGRRRSLIQAFANSVTESFACFSKSTISFAYYHVANFGSTLHRH